MFSRCFPLALLRVLFGWADLAIASHFHSRGGCGGALSARAAPNTFSLHLPALPPVAYSSLPRSWEQFKMQNSQFTIMASISRRLFLIRKTLRPGPARAKSATPAAGPGERFARKCVVNNFGCSLRGMPGDSRMFAGLRRARLRPARLKRAARCTGNRSKPLFAFSAAFLTAIALSTCCGRPQT